MIRSGAGVRRNHVVGAVALSAVAVLMGLLASEPFALRLALGTAGSFIFVVMALRLPTGAVLGGLVVWLAALGLVRRLTSGVSPKAAFGDPLLLVSAATLCVLTMLAVQRGALRGRSPLCNATIALGVLLAVSVLNPIQGGLVVGLSGALLIVLPMTAFLIGRALVNDRLLVILTWFVAWLGVGAAAYGLFQAFVGFPSWDVDWIRNEGYSALNVYGVTRAFSSFSAASEYAGYLGIALVVWIAQARGPRGGVWWPIVAGATMLLATALWYQSSRGIVVIVVASVGLMFSARAGISLSRALVVGAVLVAGLPAAIAQLAPRQFSTTASDRLAQHQVEGLSDPFGEISTLPGHIDRMRDGIAGTLHDPIGVGVGSITISATKYSQTDRGTEVDPSNAGVAAGIPGLLAYLTVVVLGIGLVYRLAAKRRDPSSLAALGIVAVTFLQWLNGGQYAVIIWPWLVLGWADATVGYKQQRLKNTTGVEASA